MLINRNEEILCALTMFFPSYQSIRVLFDMSIETQLSMFDKLIIFQCIVHLPFSVALHVSRACGDPCHFGRGLIFRKLDYTFIYISSILLSFGLSNSLIYGTCASYINAFFILKIWDESFCVYKPPVNEVSMCVLVYIFGLLVNNRIADFYMSLIVGFGAYVCTFFDTAGFAMMHIACGFLQQIFLSHLRNGH